MRQLRKTLVTILVTAALTVPGWAHADHKFAHQRPSGPAAKSFAADFITPKDSEWGWDIGGFGGEARGKPLNFNPVILLHGNAYDHTFWDAASEFPPLTINVRRYLKAQGYSDQEVWAFSLNGIGCMNTAGCGTANDVNVPDFYSVLQAVREYTGAEKVDVVTHSLSVTIARKAIKQHPGLLDQIEDFVGIAGANHGTSSCRGNESYWFGCDEIVPGSPWLSDINTWDPRGEGDETPGPVRYMTVYDGTGVADTFFLRTVVYDDSKSPRLSGADNRELPGQLHLPLARGQAGLNTWVPFIKSNNVVVQSAPPVPGDAADPQNTGTLAATGVSFSTALGVVLAVIGLGLLAAVSGRRRAFS